MTYYEEYTIGQDFQLSQLISRSLFEQVGADYWLERNRRHTLKSCEQRGGINFRMITTTAMVVDLSNLQITTYLKADY